MIGNHNFDLFEYSDNRISIKDLQGDLDLSNDKWNFIFELILQKTENYYFLGERIEYFDKDFSSLVDETSICLYQLEPDMGKILINLKPATVVINRRKLLKLWMQYEFAAVLFCGQRTEQSELMRLCKGIASYEEIAGSIENIYLIHKSHELDVLWLIKSFDMPRIW
jgi:hypothetical protein